MVSSTTEKVEILIMKAKLQITQYAQDSEPGQEQWIHGL